MVWTNKTNESNMTSAPCTLERAKREINSTITTNRKGKLVGIPTDRHLQSQGRCFCTSANNLIIKMGGLESMASDDNPDNISILETS